MAYSFIDGLGAVQTAESSIVLGGAQRQAIAIASFLTAVPTTITGSPSISGAVTVVNSSITALQGTNPWFVQLTSGSVITTAANSSVQVVGLMPPQSVSGVGIFNTNPIGNGSVLVVIPGSVATAPSPASVSGVGLFNVNHVGNGSVISTNQLTRNDAVASFLGVNLTPRNVAGDSAGRVLIKPFAPEEARIQSVIATNNTTATSLLAAGGAGLRTYITDAFVTNTAATATLVSFLDGDNSVIGRTIAPATGGSNMVGLATPMRTGGPAQIVQVTMATAVSTLGVTALGYYAP